MRRNKQKKAGRKAVVPPTHPLWHDSHVCPSTDLLTVLNVHHKDWNEAKEFWFLLLKNLCQMMKKLKVVGQNMSAARIPWEKNYECAGSKCWYLSVCATSRPEWFLPTPSWSPWHKSSNEADSSCGVNEGMTLEGGSEKSQIKRRSNRHRLITTEVSKS